MPLTYQQITHRQEVLLRGTYLSMAADVEWVMMMIITQVFKGHEVDIDVLSNLHGHTLNRFTLNEKLLAVELGFLRYKPQLYFDNRDNFKRLNEMRDMRNKFGHGKIDFVNQSHDDITITLLCETGLDTKPYKISELLIEIEEYRKSILLFLNTMALIEPSLSQYIAGTPPATQQ